MKESPVLKQKFLLEKKPQTNNIIKKPQTVVSPRNHKFSNRFYFGARVGFMKYGAIRTMCN